MLRVTATPSGSITSLIDIGGTSRLGRLGPIDSQFANSKGQRRSSHDVFRAMPTFLHDHETAEPSQVLLYATVFHIGRMLHSFQRISPLAAEMFPCGRFVRLVTRNLLRDNA